MVRAIRLAEPTASSARALGILARRSPAGRSVAGASSEPSFAIRPPSLSVRSARVGTMLAVSISSAKSGAGVPSLGNRCEVSQKFVSLFGGHGWSRSTEQAKVGTTGGLHDEEQRRDGTDRDRQARETVPEKAV